MVWGMFKILGFLLGIAVALAGPAAFGVLASGGDVSLNARETAIVYGVWALALWIAVSLFSGAGALGAFVTFGTMTYAVHFIPNRMTDLLDKIPGVTTGMIDGVKKAVTDGLVPVLTVIMLVYAFQLMVLAVRRRRALRAEELREEEAREYARLSSYRDEQLPGLATNHNPNGSSRGADEQTRVFGRSSDEEDDATTELRSPSRSI
jgi:hypothetical protein